MLGRIILRRWRPRNEETMSDKNRRTYGTRSRCATCGNFATEGENHTCPRTGKTKTHTNPAAPKPDPDPEDSK